jgi:photosystem II stability/assembly factor-like uncharacterized protein
MRAITAKFGTFLTCVLLLIAAVLANAAHPGTIDGLVVLDDEGRTILAWSVNSPFFRSTDAGHHWTRLTGVAGERLSLVTVERNRRSVLFAESYAESGGLVYVSKDQGTTWHNLSATNADTQKPLPQVDLRGPTFLYAIVRDKIVYSTNGGNEWEIVKPNITQAYVYRMWIDPRNAQTIYAGALSGLYHSTNGGVTWSIVSGVPLAANTTYAVYFDPVNPETMYLETSGVYIESSEGDLYKSVDGGQNWTMIRSVVDFFTMIPGDPSALFLGAWSQRSHQNYFILYKSTDGGGEWTKANSGLPTTRNVVTVVSGPSDHSNLYAVAGGRVFKSTDLGMRWTFIGPR